MPQWSPESLIQALHRSGSGGARGGAFEGNIADVFDTFVLPLSMQV